jgi:hypothetical protein
MQRRNAGKAFRLSQIRADPTNGFLWAKPNRHRNIWHMDTDDGANNGGAAPAPAPAADFADYASVTDEAM